MVAKATPISQFTGMSEKARIGYRGCACLLSCIGVIVLIGSALVAAGRIKLPSSVGYSGLAVGPLLFLLGTWQQLRMRPMACIQRHYHSQEITPELLRSISPKLLPQAIAFERRRILPLIPACNDPAPLLQYLDVVMTIPNSDGLSTPLRQRLVQLSQQIPNELDPCLRWLKMAQLHQIPDMADQLSPRCFQRIQQLQVRPEGAEALNAYLERATQLVRRLNTPDLLLDYLRWQNAELRAIRPQAGNRRLDAFFEAALQRLRPMRMCQEDRARLASCRNALLGTWSRIWSLRASALERRKRSAQTPAATARMETLLTLARGVQSIQVLGRLALHARRRQLFQNLTADQQRTVHRAWGLAALRLCGLQPGAEASRLRQLRRNYLPHPEEEQQRLQTSEAYRRASLPNVQLRSRNVIGRAMEIAAPYEAHNWTFCTGNNQHNAVVVSLMTALERQLNPGNAHPLILRLRLPGLHSDIRTASAFLARGRPEGELISAKRFHPNSLSDNLSLTHYLDRNTNNRDVSQQEIRLLFFFNQDRLEPEGAALAERLASRVYDIAQARQKEGGPGVLNLIMIPRSLARDPLRSPIYRSHPGGTPHYPRQLGGQLEDRPINRCDCGRDFQYRITGSWLARERRQLRVIRVSADPARDAATSAQMDLIARVWKAYLTRRLQIPAERREEFATVLSTAQTPQEVHQLEQAWAVAS